MSGADGSSYPVATKQRCPSGCCPEGWVAIEHLRQDARHLSGMVVRSEQMLELLALIRRVAPYRTPVLIQGESGTGKELVAHAVHRLGAAPQGAFIAFNCSNLVESLAESQLFGHVRGSFTDARADLPGYFRSADGGTLFMDEIGELPLALQPKLLRAVETHQIQPLGATAPCTVDVRIVAATNRDLGAMVRQGRFRDDLFYRLNGLPLKVPRLRERPADIEPLVAHFVSSHGPILGKAIRYISEAALQALRGHDWPGNVRQLKHVVETAMVMTDDDHIGIGVAALAALTECGSSGEGLDAELNGFGELARPVAPAISPPSRARPSLDEITRRALMDALEHAQGHRQRAARQLGISRARLYRMLERYNLMDFARSSAGAKVGEPA